MSDIIVVALISFAGSVIVGILGFLGTVLANRKASRDMEQKLITAQAVTDTKIEELTREVREHNNFAKRVPVVENEIEHLEEDVRILKKYHRPRKEEKND